MAVDVIEAEFSDRRRAQECTAREELEARVAKLERQVAQLLQASRLCDKEETEATPASVLSGGGRRGETD